MNPSFPNKGSPPIEGIPLKAKGIQWNFSLFASMMASKELFNLHLPIYVSLLGPYMRFSSLEVVFSMCTRPPSIIVETIIT